MKPLFPMVALAALVPAAANPSLLVRPEVLTLSMCGGGTVTVPLDGPLIPGSNGTVCCAKGCHTDDRRKRTGGEGGSILTD